MQPGPESQDSCFQRSGFFQYTCSLPNEIIPGSLFCHRVVLSLCLDTISERLSLTSPRKLYPIHLPSCFSALFFVVLIFDIILHWFVYLLSPNWTDELVGSKKAANCLSWSHCIPEPRIVPDAEYILKKKPNCWINEIINRYVGDTSNILLLSLLWLVVSPFIS